MALQRSTERLEAFTTETHRMLDDVHRDVGRCVPQVQYDEQHRPLVKDIEALTLWRTGVTARLGVFLGFAQVLGGGVRAVVSRLLA